MKQQPPQALLMQAFALHQQGQLDQANALYEQVLEKQPNNFDALHLSGVVAAQTQKHELAVERIGRAIAVNPKQAAAHNNLGSALQALNRWEQALSSYNKAIALHPTFSNAHYNRGIVLQALERWNEAANSYKKAIALQPDYAQAYSDLGNTLKVLGLNDEALSSYNKAIALAPNAFNAHCNRAILLQKLQRWNEALDSFSLAIGMRPDHAQAYSQRASVMHKLKRLEEALDSYERALAIEPENADALYGCGAVLHELNRLTEALARYNSAICLKPDHAEAYNNRGATFQKMGQLQEALSSYDSALAAKDDYADAYNNRGVVLRKLGLFDRAMMSFDRAIALEPNNAEILTNRGNALLERERWEEVEANYESALVIDPDYEFLFGSWMHVRSHICKWSSHDQDRQSLKFQLQKAHKASPSFVVLSLFDDLGLQKSASEIWTQAHHASPSPLGPISQYTRPGKIRLAYYSADFHNHATAYLMAQLFECHDRERFELYAFSFGPDIQDGMRQRLVAAFDHFIDVRNDTDQAVAQRSRDLGIDIAVDLKGYTRDSRTGIFACRCAPVQVNYLGYPGTMGAPFMDYLIADKVVIPPESQQHYSEQVVYLPHSYQVNDSQRPIAETIWRKSDLGLPEQGFVFCCFNNSYKITPSTFASWMRILQAVPGSVLWLLGDNVTAQKNLKSHAQAAGIDPNRLVFAQRMPLAEHLARHRAADLFLDTLPCNAHTTASDALWAGLPVLTQQGQAFAARVAASLLTAVGLPELIVHTAQQYEDMAIALAKDSERLHQVKQKLAAQRDTAPLFNTAQLARHIEQAYQTMHKRAQAGLAPQGFEVVRS